MSIEFVLKNTLGQARAGTIYTAHGSINTPVFMPVGTRATVKAMFPEDVNNLGAEIILGNTYHLMLRPSIKVIEKFGGLHKFMNWHKPILTDSGGFQIMSLSGLRKITEEGAVFSSHIDGSIHLLSPETSTEIQRILDSDITMIFDECVSFPCSYDKTKKSMELSLRWAERSRKSFEQRKGYGQFGIVQGSTYEDLRIISAGALIQMDFEGYAIGGLAVGEGHDIMIKTLSYFMHMLPQNKPRYLMGVGKPIDIIEAVKKGVDMFDCVLPTRSARNGQAYTKAGSLNIKNSKFKADLSALEEDCICYTCSNYSKGYLHHLIRVGEILGSMLMTTHNLYYFQDLMRRIRSCIDEKREIDFQA